jgi:hypothetical protein
MARSFKSAKPTVDLGAPAVRASRIRRDPPPKVKEISLEERTERDQRMAVIGIAAFTMAIMIILYAIASWAGWSPSQYVLHVEL